MSQAIGSQEEINTQLMNRLEKGLQQIAFFIIPTVAAFVALGDMIVGAIFQTGEFDASSTHYVWWVLIGSSVGLLASTLGRLYSSTFYALKDTKTPLKFALVRVSIATILGVVGAFYAPAWLGVEQRFGAVGLTASAGIAGWIEFLLLRRSLNKQIGQTGLALRFQAKVWFCAVVAAGMAYLVKSLELPPWHIIVKAILVLGVFGVIYLVGTLALQVPQAHALVGKIKRRF